MGIQPKRKTTLRRRAIKTATPLANSSSRYAPDAHALTQLPEATPRFIEPMKALARDEMPRDAGWSFELKLDGIRAIAVRDGEVMRIFSRRPRDLTAEYPDLVADLRRLPGKEWVIDGEIVALDERGHSSFQLLQNRKRPGGGDVPILFYVFDLLNLNGRNLASLPLEQRRSWLRTLLRVAGGGLRFSESLDAPAAQVWQEITRRGLEGVIAKRCESKYESGRRTGAWLKIKALREQEFVIGGYTPPGGTRKFFGAIIVGFYERGKLMFASKVGTGFDYARLKELHSLFQKYRVPKCPFVNLPTQRSGRFGQGLTASEMSKCVWLRPELVCQVKFLEWTDAANLRQPVFLGLRDDKPAREVTRET